MFILVVIIYELTLSSLTIIQGEFYPGSFPKNMTFVSEIKSFSRPHKGGRLELRDANIHLANGTTLRGFDHVSGFERARSCSSLTRIVIQIILATGYRNSLPFLVGLHNRYGPCLLGNSRLLSDIAII